MSYMTISSQEKHNFSLSSCFHAHSTTLLLKILGGPMHGRSPHLKFGGGDRPPQSPLGLRLEVSDERYKVPKLYDKRNLRAHNFDGGPFASQLRAHRWILNMKPEHHPYGRLIVILIVNPRFLQHPQKRSRGKQSNHRRFSKTKSIGCSGSDPQSQAGRQSNSYDGWCLELKRGGRYGEDRARKSLGFFKFRF